MLTQKYLKSILHYNPKTGIFTWKERLSKRISCGDVAGSLSREGVVSIRIKKSIYKAHRLAWLYMTGSLPKEHIDHINRVPSENQFNNLREATNQQNIFNSGISKNNKCGFKGVFFDNCRNKYVAKIQHNGKSHHIGVFIDPEEAHKAYCAKGRELFGDFFCSG